MNSYTDMLISEALEDAHMRASELVGPNSIEYDDLVDSLYETYSEPIYRYKELREEGYSQMESMLKSGLTDPDC